MPPSIHRPSIGGIQAALSSCRISKSTTTTSAPWRAFSTTPSALAGSVPPESPRFITLPEPPQSSEPRLPRVKGHLPVPRDMFLKREGNRKVTPAYIASTTQVSKVELSGEPPKTEHEARRRAMAAARRTAFAEGIQGLYVRKTQREQRVSHRSGVRRKANLAAATAPERLDDLLTRSTVRSSTANDVGVAPSPERFAVAEKAAKQHARQLARKAESRRDALAQLYVAAQSFIVDEAELEAKVNKIFVENHHHYGESIWDVEKQPISMAELRSEMTGSSANMLDSKKRSATKTTQRQKTVAEELTGGKLL